MTEVILDRDYYILENERLRDKLKGSYNIIVIISELVISLLGTIEALARQRNALDYESSMDISKRKATYRAWIKHYKEEAGKLQFQ